MEEKNKAREALIEDLSRAAAELEDLQKQYALSRGGARHKYEGLKKLFFGKLLETKLHVHNLESRDKVLPIIYAFEFLQIKLATGISGTKDMLDAQRKRIAAAFEQVELSLNISETWSTLYSDLHAEIERLKIKLGLRHPLHKKETPKIHGDLRAGYLTKNNGEHHDRH